MRKLTDILAEQNRPDDRDLRSRGDIRREQKVAEARLAELAELLSTASQKTLDELALPEQLLDCVLDSKKITSSAAKNRQLRRIRRELRSLDAEGIRARLDARLHPSGAAAGRAKVSGHWVDRLVTGGDAALDELVTAFPAADRQRLRQLARAAAAAPPERREKARRALQGALGRELAGAGTPPDDGEPG